MVWTSIYIVEWYLGRRSSSLTHSLQISSPEWVTENEIINSMDSAKLADVAYDSPLWRSRAFPVEPSRGGAGHRILVVGDSYVWGDGYANMNDLWWRQLQRELNRRGYWNIEVLALGWPGASTEDELFWLRNQKAISSLQPDIVIWGYVTNDPDTRRADKHSYGFSGRQVKQLFHQHFRSIQTWLKHERMGYLAQILETTLPIVTYQLNERIVSVSEHQVASETKGYPGDVWELKLLTGENIESYRKLLGDVAGFVRSGAVPCFFLTLPNYPNKTYFRPRHQPVAVEFQKVGLSFHDVLDAFVAKYSIGGNLTRWGINPANGHPGTCSTHFFAQQAADILETEYRDVLGPKSSPPSSLNPIINDWMPPWMTVQARPGEVHTGDSRTNAWLLGFSDIRRSDGPSAPTLFMPIRKPHVLLSFEHPVSIERIELTFPKAVTADLYASVVNRNLGYDNGDLIALGERTGKVLSWFLSKQGPAMDSVNTLRIAGSFLQESQPIEAELRIAFGTPAVRP